VVVEGGVAGWLAGWGAWQARSSTRDARTRASTGGSIRVTHRAASMMRAAPGSVLTPLCPSACLATLPPHPTGHQPTNRVCVQGGAPSGRHIARRARQGLRRGHHTKEGAWGSPYPWVAMEGGGDGRGQTACLLSQAGVRQGPCVASRVATCMLLVCGSPSSAAHPPTHTPPTRVT
jgi:hypothetical protein